MNTSSPFDGWTPDAIALVERAVAAHGGQRRWQEIDSIRLTFQSASGLLMSLKGLGRTFPLPRACEVFPHQCATVFHGYPDDRHRGRFVDGDVRIERLADGHVMLHSADHRRTFAGLAKYRRWSPLDALYFFGYALWHYHVLPFTLADARLVGVRGRHGVADGIDVVFPREVHTHCRRQQFYFGADGRILRHDYVAEVISALARGSHLWEDYQLANGILIARRRRVVVRLGRQPIPFPVLRVQFSEPSVQGDA